MADRLKFGLTQIGDLQQPFHSADDCDAGGNRKRVVAPGFQPGDSATFGTPNGSPDLVFRSKRLMSEDGLTWWLSL
jgi:hypothetical protein